MSIKSFQLTGFSIWRQFLENFQYSSQYHPVVSLADEEGAILRTSLNYSQELCLKNFAFFTRVILFFSFKVTLKPILVGFGATRNIQRSKRTR